MSADFWSKSTVVVIGGGNWGSVLAHLASKNVTDLRIWMRDEESVKNINSTRTNPDSIQGLQFGSNVKAYSELARAFDGHVDAVIWALPSSACRTVSKAIAPHFRGDEILLHATKGVEAVTMKRVSVVLREEIPCQRIGVISGPNLAHEVARGEPAATVVASVFDEVIEAGRSIFSGESFRVYSARDVIGVEWAGTLKNVLAIASGALDSLGLGWNARSMLISRGLAEMVRFGTEMGAEVSTFLGLAGVGDLLATCGSPLSRNYRVGYALAKGEKLEDVLKNLGSTAEGVRTAQNVWEFAREREIPMPITEGVCGILTGRLPVKEALNELMVSPLIGDRWSI